MTAPTIAVAGARGDAPVPRDDLLAHVGAVADEYDVVLQVLDPDAVYGEDHLRHAARLAARAIDRGTTIADDPGAELALYVAGNRQIRRALELVGVPADVQTVAVVAIGDAAEDAVATLLDRLGWRRDPALLTGTPKVLERLGVHAMDGIDPADLVLEHVALLELEK